MLKSFTLFFLAEYPSTVSAYTSVALVVAIINYDILGLDDGECINNPTAGFRNLPESAFIAKVNEWLALVIVDETAFKWPIESFAHTTIRDFLTCLAGPL